MNGAIQAWSGQLGPSWRSPANQHAEARATQPSIRAQLSSSRPRCERAASPRCRRERRCRAALRRQARLAGRPNHSPVTEARQRGGSKQTPRGRCFALTHRQQGRLALDKSHASSPLACRQVVPALFYLSRRQYWCHWRTTNRIDTQAMGRENRRQSESMFYARIGGLEGSAIISRRRQRRSPADDHKSAVHGRSWSLALTVWVRPLGNPTRLGVAGRPVKKSVFLGNTGTRPIICAARAASPSRQLRDESGESVALMVGTLVMCGHAMSCRAGSRFAR